MRISQVVKHVSSKTPVSQGSLPPAKMRALISLYHQSDSFITLENLSARIDQAFLDQEPLSRVSAPNATIPDLKRMANQRKSAPRIGIWDDSRYLSQKPAQMTQDWSGGLPYREQRVIEALYGVERGGMPGLEVLEESGERIEEDIAEDLMREGKEEPES